ncbi:MULTISPECIES: IS66 family transposase [unclassified Methylibium]|uniref:IS66 family transposase n=1 Tax=unclassified Methylibium TaxID=2633235 RepID=UPI0003F3F334|nr:MULTISPECIES: IS66 family transposase [unclassified Methylibium]EWS53759.1 Transposase [Methylibium sp. T29]EWS59853.1 Transposase [Methylibium sp. T29-B]
MLRMPGELATSIDPKSLPAQVVALIGRLQQQAQVHAQELARRDREIAWAHVKIDKLNFEVARLRRWKFDAKTEAMTASQRLLFAETMIEDEASLRAKLAEMQAGLPQVPKTPKALRAKPRRQALPEHLERVEHRHEPEDTHCPNTDCGRPMQRIGEDVSEKLDIVPARFFVHRHIYGKWACKCCQQLRQEPAEPDVVDGGIPAAGLVAHTLISRFVDHLRYYRQEPINARSGVHTPRSTLATWGGAGGAALEPLYELHRRFILSCRVLHADETPLPLLDPGAGKTKKAYVWAWARSHHDPHPGVVYEFCLGRGSQYPVAFLGGKGPPAHEPAWNGTLITDQYAAYNAVLDAKIYPQRKSAACAAHARRRFEELSRGGDSASAVATEALRRWARIYHAEAAFAEMGHDERRQARQSVSKPLWDELEVWLKLQRTQVLDGTKIAEAIDYSLNAWGQLTLHLDDGAVALDNNLIERQIKPWKLGAKNWLFAGSALAGQRAAVVMSLVQSAKLNGLDPWAYLRDVLARIHSHPSHRLEELLPHRWRPA